MLKKLPIKKDHLLIAAAILLLLISYQLAFKKTLEAWHINKHLKEQLTQAADLSVQPGYLVRKSGNLNKILDRYKTDTITFRSSTVSSIALIAENENVKLSEVPLQDPLYHTDQFIIQKLDFEGSFFALTNVLNRLQATGGIGMVRSVNYKLIGLHAGNEEGKRLVMEVYLEVVK